MESRYRPPPLAPQHEVDPATLARPTNQRRFKGRRLHAALSERTLDQTHLPGDVRIPPPMLQGASTAHGKMPARRRLAMARRCQNLDQPRSRAFAASFQWLSLDRLSRQGKGHEIALAALLGDSIAPYTYFPDVERDRHALALLSQPALGRTHLADQQADHVLDRRMQELLLLRRRHDAEMDQQGGHGDLGRTTRAVPHLEGNPRSEERRVGKECESSW